VVCCLRLLPSSLTRVTSLVLPCPPVSCTQAVNALLTQIDRLKHYENVLVLTTSNITEAIGTADIVWGWLVCPRLAAYGSFRSSSLLVADLAFIDRADIKQYIGLPNVS
jgi:SpoVK/Ycf46/Vps4 family AAA+-type ATPase